MRGSSAKVILGAGLFVLAAQLVVWLTPARNLLVETMRSHTALEVGMDDLTTGTLSDEPTHQELAQAPDPLETENAESRNQETSGPVEEPATEEPALLEPDTNGEAEALGMPASEAAENMPNLQPPVPEIAVAPDVEEEVVPTDQASVSSRPDVVADGGLSPSAPTSPTEGPMAEAATNTAMGTESSSNLSAEDEGVAQTPATEGEASQTNAEEEKVSEAAVAPPAIPETLLIADTIRLKLSDPVLRQRTHSQDITALEAFYKAQSGPALWMTTAGISPKGQAILDAMASANEWGLDPGLFTVPPPDYRPTTAEDQAATEIAISLAILKYARAARGGLTEPSAISRVFMQTPAVREPQTVLTEIAASPTPNTYLTELHPNHTQFEKLRQALRQATSEQERERLKANMERWRWMPEMLGETYVWLNIPEFTLRVMKDGTAIHSEKVVVGSAATPTPVLSADLKSIEFHPYRVVPLSIIRRSVLPALQKSRGGLFGGGSSSVLKQYQLEVKQKGKPIDPDDVDWEKASLQDFTFVQAPGPTNTLGRVQFLFPNSRDIDVHETVIPAQLQGAVRAQGESSPRIRDPEKLASLLLSQDKGWGSAKIVKLIADEKNTTVRLKNSIPVHVTYFTAWVNEDGRVDTFVDIYGLDGLYGQADGKETEQDDSASEAPPTTGSTPSPSRKPIEG